MDAYVINLDHRTDRWAAVNAHWSRYFNLIRFPAFHNPKHGAQGCKLSHLAVCKFALQKSDTAIILEDDAIPTRWFEIIGMHCIKDVLLRVSEWDYVNLGPFLDFGEHGRVARLTPCDSPWFLRTDYSHNTHAVIYNKKSLQLLERSMASGRAVDLFLTENASSQWVPPRLLSFQPDGYSDVRRQQTGRMRLYEQSVRLLHNTIMAKELTNRLPVA